jgi:hypothetical protein
MGLNPEPRLRYHVRWPMTNMTIKLTQWEVDLLSDSNTHIQKIRKKKLQRGTKAGR